jgi:hypothetical protein
MVRAMVTTGLGLCAPTATTVITRMTARLMATTGLIGFPAGSLSEPDPGSVAASADAGLIEDSTVAASVDAALIGDSTAAGSVDAALIGDSTAVGSAVVSRRVVSSAATWAEASMAEATASTAAEEAASMAEEDFTAVAASTVEAALTAAGTGNSALRALI